jgi:hypothetical protein
MICSPCIGLCPSSRTRWMRIIASLGCTAWWTPLAFRWLRLWRRWIPNIRILIFIVSLRLPLVWFLHEYLMIDDRLIEWSHIRSLIIVAYILILFGLWSMMMLKRRSSEVIYHPVYSISRVRLVLLLLGRHFTYSSRIRRWWYVIWVISHQASTTPVSENIC